MKKVFSLFDDTSLTVVYECSPRPLWSKLTPDVFSCTASVVGCDFCIYYLSTYNLTATPAACIGGCSLGTFGSCSKLVANSIVETFDLKKALKNALS